MRQLAVLAAIAVATACAATSSAMAPTASASQPATASAGPTGLAQPAPTPTAAPTVSAPSTPRPTAGARAYTTRPPGVALPSEQQCASEATSDPWEPRPGNRAANQTNAWSQGFRLRGSYLASTAPGYEERVTGNFTGTTDQIIRWAACKWGFDELDVRAQAVIESYWRQSTLGDCNRTTQPETRGCASVGLMQVKGANIPPTHPGTWPAAMTSTAFNVDYALAVRRLCFDGKETWMRQFNASYGAGDVWGYIARVRAALSARTWRSSSF